MKWTIRNYDQKTSFNAIGTLTLTPKDVSLLYEGLKQLDDTPETSNLKMALTMYIDNKITVVIGK